MHLKLFTQILLFISFALFIYGCTEEETTEPTNENTLISSSFEKNGKFSPDGWSLPALADSSNDVPTGGGNFSLMLYSSSPPAQYAYIKVPVITQFNNYSLSFWSKSTAVTSGVQGMAILSLLRNGSVIKEVSVLVEDIIWKNYSITDTFSVASGDSFLVQLTGGMSQLLGGRSFFDLCKLQAVE